MEAKKEEKKVHPGILKLLETGIPVAAAHFMTAVDNAERIPENYFSIDSHNSSRRANMWMTPSMLLCEQKGIYFGVPSGTIKFVHFK